MLRYSEPVTPRVGVPEMQSKNAWAVFLTSHLASACPTVYERAHRDRWPTGVANDP